MNSPRLGRRLVVVILALLLLSPTLAGAAVEITYFEAEWDGSSVRLTWGTASENNHAGFDIWRSATLIDSEDPATIKAQATRVTSQTIYNTNGPCLSSGQDYVFVDSSPPASDELWYYLESHDCDGVSSTFSRDQRVRVARDATPSPDTPAIVSAGATESGALRISWSAVSGAQFYVVERKQASSSNWQEVARIGASSQVYADTAVSCEQRWQYRVSATVGQQRSEPSAAVTLTTSPCAPDSLSGSRQTDGTVRLTWNDRASSESGFEVQRQLDSGWTTVATLPANSESWQDSRTLDCAESASYRVRSTRQSDGTASPWSSTGVSAPACPTETPTRTPGPTWTPIPAASTATPTVPPSATTLPPPSATPRPPATATVVRQQPGPIAPSSTPTSPPPPPTGAPATPLPPAGGAGPADQPATPPSPSPAAGAAGGPAPSPTAVAPVILAASPTPLPIAAAVPTAVPQPAQAEASIPPVEPRGTDFIHLLTWLLIAADIGAALAIGVGAVLFLRRSS
ncbi:MAG: hypothetical protein M5U01_08055 [Ardenticatenaceae bacterium]|nr:hypothetical protein [Ardenticatenaceae bacterium]